MTINWEAGTSIGTIAMAIATVGAIVVPLNLQASRRATVRIVAMRQLSAILRVFQERLARFSGEPLDRFNDSVISAMAVGLDVSLQAALSADVSEALPPQDAKEVFGALIDAMDVFAMATYYVHINPNILRDKANRAITRLGVARTAVSAELSRLTKSAVPPE